jgi:hypothetical protein
MAEYKRGAQGEVVNRCWMMLFLHRAVNDSFYVPAIAMPSYHVCYSDCTLPSALRFRELVYAAFSVLPPAMTTGPV